MQDSTSSTGWYDYANKCDCADDDNCGCDFPNNMARNVSDNDYPPKNTLSTNMLIGALAPDFTAPALLGNNTMVEDFNLYQNTAHHTTVLFFYPEDFKFTCPSELLMLNKELNAFSRRNTKLLAISTDSIYTHIAWKEIPPHKDGIADISFTLIADENKQISTAYNVLNKKQTALSATVIIDENHFIRHISLNDSKIWRNPTEIIRIIDIINYKGDGLTNCPMGWKQNFFFERPEPQTITEMYTKKNIDF